MLALLLVFELIILWMITRKLTQNLYLSLFLLTKSRPAAISIISFIFFPGTVIHELSHLFTAEILGVRTGGLTLAPEGLQESNIRTGSVLISKTDPIRRAIIGIAPVIVGLISLSTLSYFLAQIINGSAVSSPPGNFLPNPQLSNGWDKFLYFPSEILGSSSLWMILGIFYLIFAISNSMFSSPEDMEGFPGVAIALSLIGLAAYFSGISVALPPPWMSSIQQTLSTLTISMGYIVGFNLLLFGLSVSGISIAEKVSGRKIVRK